MVKRNVDRYSRGTAYHEAGHAVVAWTLSLSVGTILVREEDAGGGTEVGSASHLSLIEQIAICAAGHAAEQVFGFEPHDLASFKDHVKVFQLFEAYEVSEEEQGPALRDEGYNYACTLLECHKINVIAVAERLVETGRVDASEFLSLMSN
jgi:hypothetical protein